MISAEFVMAAEPNSDLVVNQNKLMKLRLPPECVSSLAETRSRVFRAQVAVGCPFASVAFRFSLWSRRGFQKSYTRSKERDVRMKLSQEMLKEQVAEAAVETVKSMHLSQIKLGIGTGSTAECFIKRLPEIRHLIDVTVASSQRSEDLLKQLDIPVADLNAVGPMDAYVDGADEVTASLQLIKGGGAALTREKIIADATGVFICIADESKLVNRLGRFPLPVEVIPMARSQVARQLVRLGGEPIWREGTVTDNGNVILDVHHLNISEPAQLESEINQIVGVVTNGLFARRSADLLLLSSESGIRRMTVEA